MSGELVERVARAIMDSVNSMEPGCAMGPVLARAAIAAMREPTEAMMNIPVHLGGYGYMDEVYSADQKEIWQAMIDEALK